jgi:integrase
MKAPPPEDQKTIGEAISAYLEAKREELGHTERGAANVKNMEYVLKAPREFFKNLHIRQADRVQARRYIRKRREEGKKDGTIRKEIGLVNAALAEARRAGWAENFVPLERPPSGASRDRIASKEEIRAFFSVIEDAHLRVFCMLALHTLSRPGAIFDLTWDRVDFVHNRIEFNVEGTVNDIKRRVNIEMTAALRRCLQEERARTESDFVVSYGGRKVKSVKRSFAATAKRAGLKKFIPYVFRHTGITQLVMQGASIDDVARIARDDPATIRKHYLKYSPEHTETVSGLESLYGEL